jgi:membrane protein required for colicin V production
MLTLADGFIVIVILLSAGISWMRGFVREVLSLVAWIGAFFVGFLFSHRVGDLFLSYVKTASLRTVLAFVLLFLITFILISLLNFALSFLIRRVGLSSFDRLCGAFLGVLKGVLLIGLLILLLRLTPFTEDTWWKNSLLIPKFEQVEGWLKGFMPDYVENHTISTE